eukprot:4919383-Amphidinium_carterae.1
MGLLRALIVEPFSRAEYISGDSTAEGSLSSTGKTALGSISCTAPKGAPYHSHLGTSSSRSLWRVLAVIE